MLDLRKRIFIGISVAVLVVLAIMLILLRPKQDGTGDTTGQEDVVFTDDTLTLPPVAGDPNSFSPVLTNENADERYVRQLAIDFVERFGSYSNQNRNSHIADILPLATDSMAGWIETQVQAYSDTYEGSTTKVIVSRVESFDEGIASVHIEAQQILESQTDSSRVYNKGTVELTNVAGTWKVSGLFWEN